jgi:hypothetical protein
MNTTSVWADLLRRNLSVDTGEANQLMTHEEFKLFQREVYR